MPGIYGGDGKGWVARGISTLSDGIKKLSIIKLAYQPGGSVNLKVIIASQLVFFGTITSKKYFA